MKKRSALFCVTLLALALAACGRGNQAAGGLSPDEERQLDNAAAMLDENNLVVADDSMALNAEDVAADENAAAGDAPAAGNGANTDGNSQ
jgi:hypothetical protein